MRNHDNGATTMTTNNANMNANDDEYDFVPVTKEDAEAALAHANEVKYADNKYVKLEEGDTCLRLIPLAPGMQGYGPRGTEAHAIRWVHFIKRKNGDKTLMVRALCSRLMDGEPCAACQFVNEAKLAGVTFPQSDDPSAKMEIVYNVIVRGREHLGPLLLKCGPTLHGLIQDKVRRYPRVYDPRTSGCDIIINRKGTDRDTKYLVEMDLETVQSIGSPDFVKGQHDLRPEMRNELTMSEIRAKLDELGLLSAANVRPPPAAPARRLVGATPQYPVQAPTQAAASRPAQAQPTRVDTRPAPKRSAQDMAEDDFE